MVVLAAAVLVAAVLAAAVPAAAVPAAAVARATALVARLGGVADLGAEPAALIASSGVVENSVVARQAVVQPHQRV